MKGYKNSWLTLGAMVVLVLLGNLFAGQEAQAALFSFDFTYSGDSLNGCRVGEKVQFVSRIKNTGTQADSFYVSLFEYPSTPADWWREYCAGPFCGDSTTTLIAINLNASEEALVLLDALPRSAGQGIWKITVQSKYGGVSKFLHFYLTARQTPVTSEWGLIILIMLIITSAMYLMYRKLDRVKQS
ncbi:MAG TPA: hypothetical protein VF369_07075 [candidate division Zixibacteria bacterium]